MMNTLSQEHNHSELKFWQIVARDKWIYIANLVLILIITLVWLVKEIPNPLGFGACAGIIIGRLLSTMIGVWAKGRETVLTAKVSPAIAISIVLGLGFVMFLVFSQP